MSRSSSQRKAQAAWDRIESLGGCGVWERDLVIISLGNTAVTDEDLALFREFPYVQILDLSHTNVSAAGLSHLAGLRALEELVIVDTKIDESAVRAFQREHPSLTITTVPPPKGGVNPFTRKPS